jgi:catechol 1,2-dioxygenase
MLASLGRHPYRPAHIHFIVIAAGFETSVTHTFVGDDDFIADDCVFGVKSTLVAPFEPIDGETSVAVRFRHGAERAHRLTGA